MKMDYTVMSRQQLLDAKKELLRKKEELAAKPDCNCNDYDKVIFDLLKIEKNLKKWN